MWVRLHHWPPTTIITQSTSLPTTTLFPHPLISIISPGEFTCFHCLIKGVNPDSIYISNASWPFYVLKCHARCCGHKTQRHCALGFIACMYMPCIYIHVFNMIVKFMRCILPVFIRDFFILFDCMNTCFNASWNLNSACIGRHWIFKAYC